jgi:hypothetical protein
MPKRNRVEYGRMLENFGNKQAFQDKNDLVKAMKNYNFELFDKY